MAMIKCGECGNQVSNKAASCPKCGNPISPPQQPNQKQPRQTAGCGTLIAFIAFVFVMASVWSSFQESMNPSSDKDTNKKPDRKTDEECRESLSCWAKRNRFHASTVCQPYVEELAKNDFKWTDGWGDEKFPRFVWEDVPDGILVYSGDEIQYQNGLGAWIRHTYHCKYSINANKVLEVEAEPGRLRQ